MAHKLRKHKDFGKVRIRESVMSFRSKLVDRVKRQNGT